MTGSPDGDVLARAIDLHSEKRYREAIALLEPIVGSEQDAREILAVYASSLRYDGRLDAALIVYERMERIAEEIADFWFNRANLLVDLGRYGEADECLGRALAIEPDNVTILANRGISRARLNDDEGAESHYRKALAIEPDHRLAAHNLANLLAERGAADEATALFRAVLRRWPDLAEVRYNLGRLLLGRGDFAQGAEEYEWRWRTPGFLDRPDYRGVPQWDGRPFPGRRLVVHAEQGLGDTIQFSKLLGLAKSLGGDVVFHVPEKLSALLRSLPFPVEVVGRQRSASVDIQIPLMSLLHRLKLTPGSIPSTPAHLAADETRVIDWSGRLGFGGQGKAIGLVWQGNPISPVERGRSLGSAAALAPFARLDGVRLIALQKLERDEIEPAPLPSGWRVRGLSFDLEYPGPDFDAGTDAFLDAAAIMSMLDLAVSVCTAPLHLAGALGRPAIALLKSVPDWRWGLHGDTTPWYPSMRLERQAPGEDFAPAIGRAVKRAVNMLSQRS